MNRLKTFCIVALLVALHGVSSRADDPKPPTIRFPAVTAPAPVEPPPGAATKLPPNTMYVIEGDEPFFVITSPRGFVSAVSEIGPVKIFGKFVDGTKVETRTYSAKSVCIISALKTGSVDVLVIPVGASSEEQVITKTLLVEAGEGPRPPPVDPVNPVDPEPEVDPEPDVAPVGDFKLLFLWDKSKRIPTEQRLTLNGTTLLQWVRANTAEDGFRFWDVNIDVSDESKEWQQKLEAARSSGVKFPAIVVYRGLKGTAYELPATEAATLDFLKKQKGAK